jgi:hypothetical protein
MNPSWASWLISKHLNFVSRTISILWRTVDTLLSGDSVNSGPQRQNNGVMQPISKQRLPRKRTHAQQYKSSLFYVVCAATVAMRPLLCNDMVNTPPQQERGCFCVARAQEFTSK